MKRKFTAADLMPGQTCSVITALSLAHSHGLDGVSHVLHNERKEPVVSALKTFFQAEYGNVF